MKLFHTILFLLPLIPLQAQEDILMEKDALVFQSLFNARLYPEVACYRDTFPCYSSEWRPDRCHRRTGALLR
jgi:hypothetical protein